MHIVSAIHKLACRALLIALVTCGVAVADTPSERLKSLLGKYRNVSADFVQVVSDADGEELQRSSGTLTVQRPHFMRWESVEPFQYLIITDGVTLWRYDADLEQLNTDEFTEQTAQTPAMVLGSGGRDLERHYDVESMTDGAREIFDLLPLGKENSFETLRMVFVEDLPVELRMRDFLGQVTTLELRNVKTDQKFKRSYFRYDADGGGG